MRSQRLPQGLDSHASARIDGPAQTNSESEAVLAEMLIFWVLMSTGDGCKRPHCKKCLTLPVFIGRDEFSCCMW